MLRIKTFLLTLDPSVFSVSRRFTVVTPSVFIGRRSMFLFEETIFFFVIEGNPILPPTPITKIRFIGGKTRAEPADMLARIAL